mmetsp:Transcript_11389/g.18577  ORF Transcript_11389/g.18577 Transcript_11389/m.18577 type:complete len:264 (+) Transcript_11389:254-1045(+)
MCGDTNELLWIKRTACAYIQDTAEWNGNKMEAAWTRRQAQALDTCGYRYRPPPPRYLRPPPPPPPPPPRPLFAPSPRPCGGTYCPPPPVAYCSLPNGNSGSTGLRAAALSSSAWAVSSSAYSMIFCFSSCCSSRNHSVFCRDAMASRESMGTDSDRTCCLLPRRSTTRNCTRPSSHPPPSSPSSSVPVPAVPDRTRPSPAPPTPAFATEVFLFFSRFIGICMSSAEALDRWPSSPLRASKLSCMILSSSRSNSSSSAVLTRRR